MIRLLPLLFAGLWGATVAAQPKQEVWIDGQFHGSIALADSIAVRHWVTTFVRDQRLRGRLFLGLDSISENGLYFGGGRMYDLKEAVFMSDSVPLPSTHGKGSFYDQVHYWISTHVNHGYPFVQLQVDSLRTWEGHFLVFARLDSGPQVFFDSLQITPASALSTTYWGNLTGIQPGAEYSEQLFQDLGWRIARNPWIELTKPPEVFFEEDHATIQLSVEESPQSTFEGILGILPGAGIQSATVVTGYLDLSLQNLFKSAKSLEVGFHRFADQSQMLGFTYEHPFLMGSELSAQTSFQILRQDTSFLTQEFDLQFSSFVKKVNFKFGYNRLGGQLISLRPEMLTQGLADFRRDLYQIGVGSARLDRPDAVGHFWGGMVRAAAGQKVIQPNAALDSQLYEELSLRTFVTTLEIQSQAQRMLTKTGGIHHQLTGMWLHNDEPLQNELTRLGGLRSARGFNEQMFFARQYLLSRLEWRQYFERNSYLLFFYDQLLYRERALWQYPFGVGSGLALRTSGGLFNFALAWGWLPGATGSGLKIHLGYVSRF